MVLNEGNSSANTSKRRTLEDLFRPPLDLICRGTLEIVSVNFILFIKNEKLTSIDECMWM